MESDKQQKKGKHQYDIKAALQDFENLRRRNALPKKMQIKLRYLENKLLGRSIILEDYKQLPQYELVSLQQCDEKSKKQLFVSIVKCLAGKEIIIYFQNQKSFIKKQQGFSMWHQCYISCDSQKLGIKRKVQKTSNWLEFKLKDLKVSKKYLAYKKKFCFGLMWGKDKYMIGFQHQSACSRIFKVLKQLSKQINESESQIIFESSEKSQKNNSDGKSEHNLEFVPQNRSRNVSESQISQPVILQFSRVKQKQRKGSESYLQYEKTLKTEDSSQFEIDMTLLKLEQQSELIQQQIQKQPFASHYDSDFKLIKNFELGRVLLSSDQIKTKISALFSNIELQFQQILEHYLDFKSWNMQIQESKIINRISQNSYKLLLKFKKYSLVSLSRWAIVIVTGVSYKKKIYLLLRSCQPQSLTQEDIQNASIKSVQMKLWNQSIEFCKKTDNDNKILVTIITQADFGGYCSKADNVNMSLHVMMNVHNFYNYLLAQSISKGHESHSTKLFNFSIKPSQLISKTKNVTQSSAKSSKGSSFYEKDSIACSDDQRSFGDDKKQNSQIYPNLDPLPQSLTPFSIENPILQQFVKQLERYQITGQHSPRLIQLISMKVYERHYLNHKFIVDPDFDPSAPVYKATKEDNWVTVRGRWKISEQQLVFIDQEILAQQKNVIKYILKQISTNVMAGKSIMNMSLPVEVFESRSFLEKCAETFGFIPIYFTKAANEKNIIKQMEYVSQALVFAASICPNIEKPFNPILGETFQCIVGGIKFYFEQISHHPPISSFFAKTSQFQFSGNFYPHIDMGLNSVIAKNLNPFTVTFPHTNTKYTGYTQDFDISGLMFGDRKLKSSGKYLLFEEVQELLCQLSFGKAKKNVYESAKKIKSGQIIGGIYKVSPSFTKRYKTMNFKNFDGLKSDEKVEQLAKMRGSWLGDFYVNDIKVKQFLHPVPYQYIKDLYALPSDCAYRLDTYFKANKNIKKSQEQKEVLENLQRNDRKLRQEHHKLSTKH